MDGAASSGGRPGEALNGQGPVPPWQAARQSVPASARMLRLAFCGRTSTDDLQDPTISLPRQLRSCQGALTDNAVIVAYFYDVESGRKAIEARGTGRAHEQFDIPIPRDGGIRDLLAEAESGSARFDAVICESVDRIARRTYFGTQIEHRLESVGMPLLAADEPMAPIGHRGKQATQILTRRVKQGVAEWYVLDLLEKSWGGMEEHTIQGFNIGQPPYGYLAEKVPHPVPAKRAEGKTKSRLMPDPERAPVVDRIFRWRAVETLGYATIAERLNLDLDSNPPPMPTDPSRAVGRWTESNVREILINPKYTGYMVWNKKATKTGGKINPVDRWVWSDRPTHPEIVSLERFRIVDQMRHKPARPRGGSAPNRHPQTQHTYRLRGYIHCDICDHRMSGSTRNKATVYYDCAPKPAYLPEGHPPAVYVREDALLPPIRRFFAENIFGAERNSLLDQALQLDASTTQAATAEQIASAERAIADLTARRRRQIRSLELSETLDRQFVRDVQARAAELTQEIAAKQSELDQALTKRASLDTNPDLLTALPIGAVDLAGMPEPLMRHLFDAFRLRVDFDRRTNRARCTVTLYGETLPTLIESASIASQVQDMREAGSRIHAQTILPIPLVPGTGVEPV